MHDPDRVIALEGTDLRLFIDEARREFFARPAREVDDGYEQVNSARVVIVDVYCGLAVEGQLAIVADLVRECGDVVLERQPEEIFERSGTPQEFIDDLACEVIYEFLMLDPAVVMENEAREAMSA